MFQVKTKMSKTPYTSKLPTFLTNQISFPSKTMNLKMASQQNSKRPTCQTCSKPLGLCLCTRLETPNLDNKVHVTILQHSLEREHPLNSARIAKLGLKNVQVFTVTDVMFEAQFNIQPLRVNNVESLFGEECTSSVCGNAPESYGCVQGLEVRGSRKRGFDDVSDFYSGYGSVNVSDSELVSRCLPESINENAEIESSSNELAKKGEHLFEQFNAKVTGICDNLMSKYAYNQDHTALLSVTIGKYGEISSISHQWELQNEGNPPKLDHLISTPEAQNSLAGGFVVKKLQKKQKNGSLELEQFDEFQIAVPPGSALLFPAQKAVPAEAIDFEVKNLIVLDGTWAKANRMYNENPWLKLLPAVRLDIEKLSMFSEVRHQPKPGYLSTIESIVYALKALGKAEKLVGLDNLLDVFKSMVEDQRRCKDERLRKQSS